MTVSGRFSGKESVEFSDVPKEKSGLTVTKHVLAGFSYPFYGILGPNSKGKHVLYIFRIFQTFLSDFHTC